MKRAASRWTVGFLVLSLASTAHAGEVVEWFKTINLNAFASASYMFNFNRPASMMNQLRAFDYDHNSFRIDVAEVVIQKAVANKGDFGFRLDVTYGAMSRITAARGLFRDINTGVAQDIDLQQAFISYIVPVGRGLRVDIGKFATLVGAEYMEGYDGWNDHLSHSWLFTYGPYTHTGFKLSYSFHDKVAATVMLSNGWDVVEDNNQAKSLGINLALTLHQTFAMYLTYLGGPEMNGNDKDFRHLIDFIAQWKPHWRFAASLNFDWGMCTNAVVTGMLPGMMTTANAQWIMAVLYLRAQAHKRVAINFRGEVFWDRDGNRTGVAQTLLSATLTAEFKITDSFFARVEGRYDQSDAFVFERNDGGKRKYQPTLGVNAIYVF